MTNNKTKRIFLFIYIIFIIFIVLLLEIFLRMIHYGIDTNVFVKHKYAKEYYVENSKFLNKYHTNLIDEAYSDPRTLMKIKKDKEVKRCFVIGGSTAQGFPFESNHSFGKMTEMVLNGIQEKDKFEIINVSYSAMSSFYVKDVSLKLLKYQPDMVIIYSGHNEYYGTFGYLSGKYKYLKDLYIYLREYKIFQLIDNTIKKIKKRDLSSDLMQKQYNNKTIEKNDEIDDNTSKIFIDNIKKIVKVYQKRDIPVIIVEPVSNLINMPPFKSKYFDKNKELIMEYYEAIIEKNISKANDCKIKSEDYQDDAILIYLNCINDIIFNNKIDIETLKIAKDSDNVPFRARNALINGLRKDINYSKNIYYIPLEEKLLQNFGPSIFGKQIFCDHLHFNLNGNWILSYFIAEKIIEIYGYKDTEKIRALYNNVNSAQLKKLLTITDLNEIIANNIISGILIDSPFKEMIIKPDLNSLILSDNQLVMNEKLIDSLRNSDQNSYYNVVYKYYLDNNKYEEAIYFLKSMVFCFPNNADIYLKLSDVYTLMRNEESSIYFKNIYKSLSGIK